MSGQIFEIMPVLIKEMAPQVLATPRGPDHGKLLEVHRDHDQFTGTPARGDEADDPA
jgi:hypothetical protein